MTTDTLIVLAVVATTIVALLAAVASVVRHDGPGTPPRSHPTDHTSLPPAQRGAYHRAA